LIFASLHELFLIFLAHGHKKTDCFNADSHIVVTCSFQSRCAFEEELERHDSCLGFNKAIEKSFRSDGTVEGRLIECFGPFMNSENHLDS
jgi:hypothetical protein